MEGYRKGRSPASICLQFVILTGWDRATSADPGPTADRPAALCSCIHRCLVQMMALGRAGGVLGTPAPCSVPDVCSPASPHPPSSLSQTNPRKPGLKTLLVAHDHPEMLLLQVWQFLALCAQTRSQSREPFGLVLSLHTEDFLG